MGDIPSIGRAAAMTNDFTEAEDIATLGAAVAAATNDVRFAQDLAEELRRTGKQELSPETRQRIARRAASITRNPSAPRQFAADDPFSNLLMEITLGRSVDENERLMLLDQSGLLERPHNTYRLQARPMLKVAVIGAGASGLAVGRELLCAGYEVDIFERSTDVSGVWSQNRYPGCGVDSPSYVYSYSFATNSNWSRYFVRRSEINSYLRSCSEDFGLQPVIRLETEVVSCTYDEVQCQWEVISQSNGKQTAQTYHVVVSAVGQLNTASYPNIEGLDQFSGTVVHTAEWNDSVDITGKRVAVIGVGASAMQVVPTIAPQVAHLSVFQRQPHWVMPNRQYLSEVQPSEISILSAFPDYLAWKRVQYNWSYGDSSYPALIQDPEWPSDCKDAINAHSARARDVMSKHISRELASRPELIERMTPDYPPYSKRVLLDNNWYKTFLRENVSLVSEGITRITPDGIQTRDGTLHPFDVIVLATGYKASDMLATVSIVNGKGTRLKDVWNGDDPRAYLGVTVPEFPNFFIMYGPNTNLVFGSAIIHSEIQSQYILQCLQMMQTHDADEIQCTQDAFQIYNDQIDRQLASMVWEKSDATNWFTNKAGRITTNSPWSMGQYWALLREPDPSAYRFGKATKQHEEETI